MNRKNPREKQTTPIFCFYHHIMSTTEFLPFLHHLLNSTNHISVQTITNRLTNQWQLSSITTFVVGVGLLFFGSRVYSFSRRNLVPIVICVLIHLFRPSLQTFSETSSLHFLSPYYLPECVSDGSCTWEKSLFDSFWFTLAFVFAAFLRPHTKMGEQVIVGVASCVGGALCTSAVAKYVFHRLVLLRDLLCKAVSQTSCPDISSHDEQHMILVTLIFGLIGAVFFVPRALRMYKTVLRAFLSVFGAMLVTISLSVLCYVHLFERAGAEGWLHHVLLPGWLTSCMLLTPSLAFSGFVWQETSYLNYRMKFEERRDNTTGEGAAVTESGRIPGVEQHEFLDGGAESSPRAEQEAIMRSFQNHRNNSSTTHRRHVRAKTPTR